MFQIHLEVVNNPVTVVPGERTTITVTVRGEGQELLPGAKVTIDAGGGEFIPPEADPPPRTTETTGTTNREGQFKTEWVEPVNPGASSYVFGIEASKEGFKSAATEHVIAVK